MSETMPTLPQILELRRMLEDLQPWEISIGGGCECCGTYLERDRDAQGEYIRTQDVDDVVEYLSSILQEKPE